MYMLQTYGRMYMHLRGRLKIIGNYKPCKNEIYLQFDDLITDYLHMHRMRI